MISSLFFGLFGFISPCGLIIERDDKNMRHLVEACPGQVWRLVMAPLTVQCTLSKSDKHASVRLWKSNLKLHKDWFPKRKSVKKKVVLHSFSCFLELFAISYAQNCLTRELCLCKKCFSKFWWSKWATEAEVGMKCFKSSVLVLSP